MLVLLYFLLSLYYYYLRGSNAPTIIVELICEIIVVEDHFPDHRLNTRNCKRHMVQSGIKVSIVGHLKNNGCFMVKEIRRRFRLGPGVMPDLFSTVCWLCSQYIADIKAHNTMRNDPVEVLYSKK